MSNCYNSELPIGPPGPTGPTGLQGVQGLNGTVWLNGEGPPGNEIGVNNDYYLDTLTGDLYTKIYVGLGLRWQFVIDIAGANGAPGEDGENGVALQWIPFGEGEFFKSLGTSTWITPLSTGLDTNYYSTFFYILGEQLCPVDNSIARITIYYETTGGDPGAVVDPAYVNFNLTIKNMDNGDFNSVTGIPIPKAILSNIGYSNTFTKVCYTIRRKSINTAEIITEWATSNVFEDDEASANTTAGSYYSPVFLTDDNINFAPNGVNEFKFNPIIADTTPTSSPQTRAISFYIEKLR